MWGDFLRVFVVGGIICVIGQVLMDTTKGVMEEVDKNGLLGIVTGGVSATSAGIAAAVVFGYLMSVLFDSKTK